MVSIRMNVNLKRELNINTSIFIKVSQMDSKKLEMFKDSEIKSQVKFTLILVCIIKQTVGAK